MTSCAHAVSYQCKDKIFGNSNQNSLRYAERRLNWGEILFTEVSDCQILVISKYNVAVRQLVANRVNVLTWHNFATGLVTFIQVSP